MSKKRLNEVYKFPLPLHIRPFPPIIPHNPLSVVWVLWEFIYPRPAEPVVVHGSLDEQLGLVKVQNETDMDTLWKMGFFGKGTFSRSEPTWFARTATKLGLQESELTAEDITRQRRLERKKFKQERALAEQIDLDRIKKLESEGALSLEQQNGEFEEEAGNSESNVIVQNAGDEEITGTDDINEEIDEIDSLLENGRLKRLEYLQLMPTEAIFLSYGLGVLRVRSENSSVSSYLSSVELFKLFISANRGLLYEYIAYHHYRSLGWCVRSGVKFGTDLILYRRGPPFSHAEFGIIVVPVGSKDEKQPWWWNTSVGRVIGGVKKTLVFCYIDGPEVDSIDLESISHPSQITALLKSFKIREVVYRRWIPSRNRD
jgi:tRNA-splicing endonuclease subunit Sen2